MRVDPSECLAAGERLIRAQGAGLPLDALVRSQRAATRLEARPIDDAQLPVGASKFGGLPDLPATVEWPRWAGVPEVAATWRSAARPGYQPQRLSFLAQLDLARVPDPTGLLPERGWLYFFYDASQQPWGFDPLDAGSARVLYFDGERAQLHRAARPDDFPPNEKPFRACAPMPSLAPTLPSLPRQLGLELEHDAPAFKRYVELADGEISGREPHHRLFGWPKQIQGEMELGCQLVTNGIDCSTSKGYKSREAKRLAAGAADWILLLQLDTDDGPGWMWGDAGCLYFWIRKQDLAARRFDRTWTVLQCY